MNELRSVLNYIEFSDITQREGRQAFGFHLNSKNSIKYAQLTSKFGIQYLELNHPASSSALKDIVSFIAGLDLANTKTSTHVRCNLRDVELALSADIKCINTYIPINPYSDKDVITAVNNAKKDLQKITALTSKEQAELRVSLEHSFSLPLELLTKSYQEISHIKGISRIGVADTTGTCFPEKIIKYVQAVYSVIPSNMTMQIHLHNDHGLASANFLEILYLLSRIKKQAIFDISISGLGERNGILSFGDVFSVLYLINPEILKNKYDLMAYAQILEFIKKNSQVRVSRRDPLNPLAFSHSAGPHLNGMVKNNRYQRIEPEEFGLRAQLNIGHCVTGWQGVKNWIQINMQKKIEDHLAKRIAEEIREYTIHYGPLKNNNLKKFISSYLN